MIIDLTLICNIILSNQCSIKICFNCSVKIKIIIQSISSNNLKHLFRMFRINMDRLRLRFLYAMSLSQFSVPCVLVTYMNSICDEIKYDLRYNNVSIYIQTAFIYICQQLSSEPCEAAVFRNAKFGIYNTLSMSQIILSVLMCDN